MIVEFRAIKIEERVDHHYEENRQDAKTPRKPEHEVAKEGLGEFTRFE